MLVLFVVAWPISIVLDWALGREMGKIFTKKEIEHLIQLHAEDKEAEVTTGDAVLMKGAIRFGKKKVGEIMTPPPSVRGRWIRRKLRIPGVDVRNGLGRGSSESPGFAISYHRNATS